LKFTGNIIGRLKDKPEIRDLKNDGQVAVFVIATDVGWGDKKETVWMDCEAFNKRDVTVLEKYVKKGRVIDVEGDFRQESWTDKTTGVKRNKLKLNVTKVTLLPGGKGNQDEGSDDEGAAPAPPKNTGKTSAANRGRRQPEPEEDDDIPF
jgi:single-strand DNA-binding protein